VIPERHPCVNLEIEPAKRVPDMGNTWQQGRTIFARGLSFLFLGPLDQNCIFVEKIDRIFRVGASVLWGKEKRKLITSSAKSSN
jgi:hypothetical protein